MLNKKVSAYTLMEITIAMLIAAVCLGIAYYAMNLFLNANRSHHEDTQKNYALHLFLTQLEQDIDHANCVLWDDIELLSLHSKEKRISYQFHEDNIIRTQNGTITDSLLLKPTNIIIQELPYLNASNVPVSGISLDIDNGKKTHPVSILKTYSSEELLQTENIDK